MGAPLLKPGDELRHLEMLDHPQNNSRSYRRYVECRRYVPEWEVADRPDDVTCPRCRAVVDARENLENCP